MPTIRHVFPWVALAVFGAALVWAISFGTPERADFVFNNLSEVQTLDPPQASGQTEGRVIDAIFEGLCRDTPSNDPILEGFLLDAALDEAASSEPERGSERQPSLPSDPEGAGVESEESDKVELVPGPGVADRVEISADGLEYRFRIREGAVWSDGTPLTADDFVFSWWRMLHPETIEKYAYLLYYVRGAEDYDQGVLTPGGPVEIERADRLRELENVPRGTMLHGTLVSVHRDERADAIVNRLQEFADEPSWTAFLREPAAGLTELEQTIRRLYGYNTLERAQLFAAEASIDAAVMVVDHPTDLAITLGLGTKSTTADLMSRLAGLRVAWARNPDLAATHFKVSDVASDGGPPMAETIEQCQRVLPDFAKTVALEAIDDRTFRVGLSNRTPFFLSLTAFYPLYPTPRHAIEQHGMLPWTRAENIVTNGPYQLQSRRLRDRIALVRSDRYWNRNNVAINRIDVLAIEQDTSALNMYLKGEVDWIPTVPLNLINQVKDRPDFHSAPMLTVYFYRLNVTRKPMNDVRVRRALNMAIDKSLICETIAKAGERPARHIVPDGMAGYQSPMGDDYDPIEAKRLIDEVRDEYASRNEPFPTIEITYNTQEGHQKIAEAIMRQWTLNLGIPVKLRNMEWASYLNAMHSLDFLVCRAGWIGDYVDPNTFLDMWVTGGGNNETGWSNTEYDRLIREAQAESDPAKRMTILADAEQILLDEQPIIPIYFYVSKNMVNPRINGFFNTLQDLHPLHQLTIEGPPARPDSYFSVP